MVPPSFPAKPGPKGPGTFPLFAHAATEGGGSLTAPREASSEASTEQHPVGNRPRRAVVEYFEKADRMAIENTRKQVGADISNHRPEDLRTVDDLLDEYMQKANREAASMAFGSYLGEVFVRNLAARWHYPNWFQALRALTSWDRFRAERYCYVLVGDEKFLVFRAAREAIEKTGAVFSLYEFYQRYGRTAYRS